MNEKRIFRSILFVGIVAIVAILAMAGNGNAQPTGETIELGGHFATNANATATSEDAYIGEGCWKVEGATAPGKFEFYIYWYDGPGGLPDVTHNLGVFTIDDIQSISYHTNKPLPTDGDNPYNFYLVIYTLPDDKDDHGWYGYALHAEPYFARNLSAPANTWNEWNTDPGINHLTFCDHWKSETYGFYGEPTLQEIQAGTINWEQDYGYGVDQDIDYGLETVMAISFQTASAWYNSFDGYIDAITITLKNGTSLTIDLENEVWVDDDYDSYTPGWGYDHFASIQDGIDAVGEGGIVHVADGIYNEQLTINKPLTLMAGSNPVLDFSGYSGYGIHITADGVTIDGFEIIGIPITGPDDWQSNVNPTILVEANYTTVQNCVFNNASGAPAKEAMLTVNGTHNNSFLNNVVNNYIYGITARSDGWGGGAGPGYGATNLTVSGNTFNVAYIDDGSNRITGEAVQIWYGDNIVVTDNVINGPGKFVDKADTYTYLNSIGIADFMSGFGAAGTITYSNNQITNCYVGIATFAGNGIISNNLIDDNYIGIQVGQVDEVLISTPAQGVQILNNDITNNIRGIWVQNFVPDGICAHNNNIVGNTEYGIINEDQDNDVFDATCNWWGDATGPYYANGNWGNGDNVSGNVDYCPWLDAPYPGGNAVGPVQNINTGEYFCTIQDAIDAARDGDTIVVHDGTYHENVIINKEITLQAGSSPVINGHGGTCIVVNADNVTIDGLITYNGTNGIVVSQWHNNITIQNNIIKEMGGTSLTNAEGIVVERGCTNVTIDGNEIYNISATAYAHGIMLYGNDGNIDTVFILNNEIHHIMYAGHTTGITIHSYVTNVTIDDNYIHNISATNYAVGIVIWTDYVPLGIEAPASIYIANGTIENINGMGLGSAGIGADGNWTANDITIYKRDVMFYYFEPDVDVCRVDPGWNLKEEQEGSCATPVGKVFVTLTNNFIFTIIGILAISAIAAFLINEWRKKKK